MNILITGANRGIGLELTKQLSAAGHTVFALCRHSSEELKESGVTIFEGVDVTSEETLKAIARDVPPPLDWIINNAGIMHSTPLESLGPESFEKIVEQFEVNALAPLKVVWAFSNHLRSGSKIGMITSRMGSIADNTSGGAYGYRASKCALNAFCRSLAYDLKDREIPVAILHPGYVQTDMTGHSGHITPQESAAMLIERMKGLDLNNTGTFWHANGEVLPW